MSIKSNLFLYAQSKCERYWRDEMNEPFEIPDRGFTVTVTGKKVYADYEIRDMTIRSVSIYMQGGAMSSDRLINLLVLQPVSIRWLIHPLSPSNWSTFSSLPGLTMECPSTLTPWSNSFSMSGRCSKAAQLLLWSIAGVYECHWVTVCGVSFHVVS